MSNLNLIIQHLIDAGELVHIIYAILFVIVVALIRGFTIQAGNKSISFGKGKNEKTNHVNDGSNDSGL